MLALIGCLVILLCACAQLCDGFPPLINDAQAPFSIGVSTAGSDQRKALIEAEIIPKVVNDFVPSISIELSYSSRHKSVDLGNSIRPKHVGSPPVFSINNTDADPTPTQQSDATYVLALTDPDATSRADPAKAQMCHWIVTNITKAPSSSYSFDSSETVAPYGLSGTYTATAIGELISYLPPTPPPKSGYHRYVFVVLTLKSYGNGTKLKKPGDRSHWGYGKVGAGVREWAEDNSLQVVGANFFYCKNKEQ